MTSAQLAPAILFPFILWRVYVRVRRNVGRQPLVVKSLKIRIWIFALLCVLFGAGASLQPGALLAFLGGLVGSVLLAWFGVRLTRFERTQNGDFYTPNTVIGVTLSLLLVGRVVYRFMTLYSAGVLRPVPGQLGGAQSALTLAILGLTFGYYVAYNVGVLMRARHLDGAPAEPLS